MIDAELSSIDDESRPDHAHLRPQDDCYYLMEYTAARGFDHSPGNQFINNFKKSPLRRANQFEWRWKLRAIADAATALLNVLPANWMENSTFVPVPPSKLPDHPEYDDRMAQVLKRLPGVDVRELVKQIESMESTHTRGDDRYSIQELVDNYEIEEDETDPEPEHIVIVDDMVTAGAHFKAMARVLSERFPGVRISGVFLTRRVFAQDEHQLQLGCDL